MTMQMADNLSFQVHSESKNGLSSAVKPVTKVDDKTFSSTLSDLQADGDKSFENNEIEGVKFSDISVEAGLNLPQNASENSSLVVAGLIETVETPPLETVDIANESVQLSIPAINPAASEVLKSVDGKILPTTGNLLPTEGLHDATSLVMRTHELKPDDMTRIPLTPSDSIVSLGKEMATTLDLSNAGEKILPAGTTELSASPAEVIESTQLRNNFVQDFGAASQRPDDPGFVKAGLIPAQSPVAVTSPVFQTSLSSSILPDMTLNPQGDNRVWGEGVGERVQWMINQKLNSATIRLDPPHLGKLDVQINLSADSTTIHINTQQAQTREMLENASARLRDFLQESGFENVNVDISHQQQSQQNESSSMTMNNSADSAEDNTDESGIIRESTSQRSVDGLVDYFA